MRGAGGLGNGALDSLPHRPRSIGAGGGTGTATGTGPLRSPSPQIKLGQLNKFRADSESNQIFDQILNISGYISNFKIVTIQFLDQSSLIQKFLKFDLKFNSISDRPKIYWTGPIRFQSMDFEPVQFQPNSYHGTMRWIHEMWTEMLWREMNLLYWEIFLWARCICYTVIVFVSLSRIGIWKFLP